jgi:uncharacterized protein (TIGR00290 family)
MPTPTLIAWSGGKDSAMALWQLPPEHRPIALLTNVQAAQGRVSVHGVRRDLIERQAAALGLPLHIVELPEAPSNAEYEAQIEAALAPFQAQGVAHIVYGDLFLADIRAYRDAHLARIGMQGVYPLWKRDTAALIRAFIGAGFRAIVTCVDTTQLDASFTGREVDETFLRDLPAGVDPCGENGEFHTFVYAGPLFKEPLLVTIGDTFWMNDRFWYCDLR